MKIAFVVSEAVPYIKTGGLGDVAGTLPIYLNRLGFNTILILPLYKKIKDKNLELELVEKGNVKLGERTFPFSIYRNREAQVYFIENDEFFLRDSPYNTKEGDYPDNYIRFAFFSKVSLDFIVKRGDTDVIHVHDWQTALLPVYKRLFYPDIKEKVVLTIHNIGYQGIFSKDVLKEISLPPSLFTIDGLEFYGNVNYLKGGILFSDCVTTVSPSYAKEIQTKEYGFGLEGVLRKIRNKLYGILNGIDYSYWNPETDKFIKVNYGKENLHKKSENKLLLFKELNIDFDPSLPLFSIISRLVPQKGIDILIEGFDDIMKLPLNFVLLGTGDREFEEKLMSLGEKYRNKFIPLIKFDESLAHRIYAASDFFLMPSKFEPCGLGQMIALRYGTVPVVRRTGGLKDTIQNYHEKTKCGNGISFDEYDSFELVRSVERGVKIFKDIDVYERIQKIGMSCDYSWDSSAKEYLNLYRRLKEE